MTECCEMLGNQRAGGMVCGRRGCLISEVNLMIACCSSVPNAAVIALSYWFVTGLRNWGNTQYRRAACSACCSLESPGSCGPIALDMFKIGHGKR